MSDFRLKTVANNSANAAQIFVPSVPFSSGGGDGSDDKMRLTVDR
jgi:hypothetical protein